MHANDRHCLVGILWMKTKTACMMFNHSILQRCKTCSLSLLLLKGLNKDYSTFCIEIPGSRGTVLKLGLSDEEASQSLEEGLWALAKDDIIGIGFIKNSMIIYQSNQLL